LVYIFYYFYEELNEPKGNHLSENYCFWFATGILIYLSGSFFFNILANIMDRDEITKYWFLSYIADIIKNILLAIGLRVMAKQTPNHKNVKKNIPYLDMN
jgi:biotin transporter BioY